MPSRHRSLLTCCFLLLLALLGTSCTRQARMQRALTRADTYFASSAFDQAEVEYLTALKLDPENGRTIAQLGLIYAKQGRIGKAPAFLLKARRLQPDNLDVRSHLAMIYLAAKKTDDARTELRYILEHQPDHAAAPLLLAESALQTKDAVEITAWLEKLSTARTGPVLTALATLELSRKRLPEAEALLQQALALDPKSVAANAVLGTCNLARHNLPAAEEAFSTTWKYATAYSPHKLIYVRFKLQTGDSDGARRLLTELTLQNPDSLPPVMMLAELNAREKKFAEALTLTDRILLRDPYHYQAMMLSARLQLAEGNANQALLVLGKLKGLQPKNPEIPYQSGQAYLALGDTTQAVTSLNQAVELAPGYADAIMLLAELNLKKGDAITASVALKNLVTQHPELKPARILLARAYASQGNLEEAVATFQAASALDPHDPNLLLPVAQIYFQLKKFDETRSILTKVLELSPDSESAIELSIDLDLRSGNLEGARQRAEALQARRPNQAGSFLLLAKTSLAEKNLSRAETELLKAIELQPDTPTAYYLLAGIYSQTHQDKKALVQLEQIAGQTPKNAALLMRIALLQEQLKEYPAAREAYEKVLALEPNFLPAMNNLAYLDSEQFNDLAHGLVLAKKARELAPLNPNIADTLGWILFRQGQYQQARTLLVESATKSPDDAAGQYHLGMAYYMMGETGPARQTLQHALQLNPDLPEKNLVTQRLEILDADTTQGGPELRATLEQAVAAHPDDPVALTRLGTILLKSGELDRAEKTLNDALTINPLNVSASLSLIQVHLGRHETTQALELAKAVRKQAPNDPTVSHQLGRIAFQTGEYQWAASLLQESSRKLPDDREVLFDRAKAAYSIGRVAEATELMHLILQTKDTFSHGPETSLYLEMIALAADPSSAGSVKIDQALQADPTFVPALMALGAAAEKQPDAAAAKQAYEKALAQYPDFIPAKRNLVLLAAASAETNPKAYDLALQTREAFPNDPAVAEALGILTYRKSDFSRAAGLLKESIVRLGEDARRTYYLGMAQYRLKDGTAPLTLKRSLELGLKDEAAAEVRQALAAIK